MEVLVVNAAGKRVLTNCHIDNNKHGVSVGHTHRALRPRSPPPPTPRCPVQVLRLPHDQGLSLLAANRPLLSISTQLPERMETLRSLLGTTTDQQLFALLHKRLTILRYPSHLMTAKAAAVQSLVSLHPPWAAMWAAREPVQVLRVITLGWASIYRLAYLIATAQADNGLSPLSAMKETRAEFARFYPGFEGWLERCGLGWWVLVG